MRRLRLSTLLMGIYVGLMLFTLSGMALIAMQALGQMADDQALDRVTRAGLSAQAAAGRAGQDVLTGARQLAQHPALPQLVQAQDTAPLAALVSQTGQALGLDASAVLLDGRLLAHDGLPLDWPAIAAARLGQHDFFLYHPSDGGPLILAGGWPVEAQPGAAAWAAVQVDESFTRQIGGEAGLPVTIFDPRQAIASGPLARLRAQVLETGEPISTRAAGADRFVSIVPLRTPGGRVVGVIETELPAAAAGVDGRLPQSLTVWILASALAAALISLLVGRRLGHRLQVLSAAANRIGRGDLTTPVPATPGLEIGILGDTLEEMRRRLRQLTANLTRQQAESDAILTGIVEGVFAVDRERRIQYLNPQTAALLGVAAEAAIGRFCGDVLNPQGEGGVRPCEEHCPIIHARFRAGARATEHLLLRSGRRRSVVITSAPPLDEQPSGAGKAVVEAGLRQIQVMRDETEEEATRRMRDAVLANISHEFKTPLSAQLASIELLLDQLPSLTTDQIADLVISLQRGTLRLTQLIDNLLESVRIEAGRFAIRRRPIAIDDVIEQALEMTRPLIDQRQQEVTVELPYPLPPIPGDAPRLTQVFVNLLANANKFSLPGSLIRIGGRVEDADVTIWVEDQGPGLPADDDSVFAPFARSLTEDSVARGVGLGLWIVKSVIEGHGGRVAAHSNAGGARISVTLPRDTIYEDSRS